jgi:hypothetical protein
MPYWVELWPAARMLAKVIVRQPGCIHRTGSCALGWAADWACRGRGAVQGTAGDVQRHDATALRFAADNARRNGFDDFDLLQLDWRHPPATFACRWSSAADLIYEIRNVAPWWASSSTCWPRVACVC